MRRRGELASTALACVVASGLWLHACGGKRRDARAVAPDPESVAEGADGDDRGRCEYRGRADREVEETASADSRKPNIRRVYTVVGDGEEMRRVLLCREVDTNLDGMKDVVRTYNDKGDVLRELVDSDFDGRIDTWTTFALGRVAEVKVDRSRDGEPDERRMYVQGKKVRTELDTNLDGRPDVWEVYEEGHLRRRGVDLDNDGHVDRWDRDMVSQRAEEERERQAEAERTKREGGGSSEVTDAGVTDARVSARHR